MKSLLVKINNKLNAQGGFLKAVSVLVGGTAVAQGTAILALPLLTRLYSPEEFSLFAIYTSLLFTLSVASCLRLEIAIPIPESDVEAIYLVVIALLSNFIISLLLVLIIWIFHSDIIFLLRQSSFSSLIWLVPVGVFFSGLYNTLQYWSTRKKNFSLIAKNRIVQSISGVSLQVLMGIIGYSTLGLIIGQIVKVSAGIWRLMIYFWNEASIVIKNIKVKKLKEIFKKNDSFPKYSTLDALANTASIQLPIIIIAALTINAEAGYLIFAMQLLGIPMQFIGGAISQVYLAHAPEAFEHADIRIFTREVLDKLFKFSFSLLVFIGIVSPSVIGYIFGDEWSKAGIIISWMIPWFIFQLISSPISMIMHIANQQKKMLFLTVFGFIFKVGSIYFQYYIDSNYLLQAYAISSAIFYFICYFVFSQVALLKVSDHLYLAKRTLPFFLLTLAFSYVMVFLLKWVGP